MKKIISIILACSILIIGTIASSAVIVNQPELISTDEAVKNVTATLNRIYFKMPQNSNWYSDFSVYQGKYYPAAYWWEGSAASDTYPGYRTMIEDYEQGVYYANIPENVPWVIWNNGFHYIIIDSQMAKEMCSTFDVPVEDGAEAGEYDTIPEGCESFDGCIYVAGSVKEENISGGTYYDGDWYFYYGNGCYGSYATTSDNFTSVEENCCNPDHFDAQSNHIGGDHIKAPEAPENAAVDPVAVGYYYEFGSEPGKVLYERKLQKETDGTYAANINLSPNQTIRITYYGGNRELINYPAEGYLNEKGDVISVKGFYKVTFNPDDESIDIKLLEEYGEQPTTVPTEAATEPKDLYRERLKERYNLSEFDGDWYTYQLKSYKELYYHRDSSGEIDWALIQCYCNIATPVEMTAVVGNRVLHPGTAYYPFDTTFGIYDVKNDKFIDPSWSGQDYLGGKEAYKYDGFVRAFDEIVGGGMGEPLADVDYRGKGRPLGDIDNNGELDITDVTMVQRCDAQIMEYPATDELWLTYDYNGDHYYSDFNLDGERDIVDATCIQRYLVDMDYPIG